MKRSMRALLLSTASLVLCFAMLIGTTYAWFTDSVESGVNQIIAGNLDVELEYAKKPDGTYKDITSASDVFIAPENSEKGLWEPGHTEVAYLKVTNKGDLALKYSLQVKASNEVIGKNAENEDIKLSEILKFSATEPSDAAPEAFTRDSAQAAASASSVKLTEYSKEEALGAGESHYVALVVYMPKEVGNEANYRGDKVPEIDFAITLFATQAEAESDSFGSDYDKEAFLPVAVPDTSASQEVSVTDNKVDTATTIDAKTAVANIPEGVEVTDKTLTLSVSDMDNGEANVTLGENEEISSLDVHIKGVAKGNTVPMEILLIEAAPKGMNQGNLKLYHVENGATNAMLYVETNAAFTEHNQFKYDPATGDVILYMATFSEVAVVADTEKAWEGNFDYSWYTNAVAPVDGEAVTEYIIANADQLAAFGAIVGGMNGQTKDSFAGKTVKLIADINLGDKESENNPNIIFYPIGYYNSEGTYERTNTKITSGLRNFEGTFDGNGHTVSNFYQNTWEMKGDHDWYSPEEQYYRDGMGLFGRVYKGTVKNLTVKNFSSDGEIATTGVIAAYADGAAFENIAIFNCNPRVYNIGNGGIVGCVGWYAKEADLKTTFKNITVDNSNKISALWGSYDVACGGIVGQYYPTSGQTSANKPANGGIHFENCHISAIMDVYNDVCANYQYYAYRYTGMLIGSVRENETIDGHSYPKMDGITAKDCTVHFGTWNDYYYCEIIDNTTASYTHDYQMSRLTEIKAIDGTTITYLDGTTGTVPASGRANYVIVDYTKGHGTENATCYHFKDGAVWTHDMGGIQTGIDENGDGQDDLKEDKQHIYLEFNNLVTGYGWGVTSRGFNNLDGVTNLDIAQGDQEASVEKFEDAGYTPKDYRPGETITIGDLFKVKGNAVINGDSVYVSVSPVTEGDKASAIFVLNEEDWTKSTITFADDSTGTAKVTITDYIFCTPTTIYLNEEEAVEKFTASGVVAQNAYTQITLGTIFGVKNGATIGNVTATFTDPNGNKTTIAGTSADWTTKTIDLIKEGTWTVSIVDDDKYCAATETTFTVNKVDKFTKKFNKDFLYRVGNQNAVDIGNVFGEIETAVGLSSVNVSIANVAGNAAGEFIAKTPWTYGTVQFTGTGVVKVTISANGANPVEINLEVVDATNVESAPSNISDEYKNYVFVKDINTNSHVNHWNCTIYGNGFTYSLEGAPTAYNSKHGHGILITKNATLDNLIIVGDIYNGYGAYSNNDYYNAAVDVLGRTVIQNCCISNCAAPIRARDSITISNSTLYGGAVANLLIMSGTATLENVITANYDDGRQMIGMGIVVHKDATDSVQIVINGNLTQYNFISEGRVPSVTEAKNLHTAMFSSACDNYHFGTSPNRYVNTGIISLSDKFGADNIIDNAATGYEGQAVTLNSYDGYVYTQPKTKGTVNNNCIPYTATTQGEVAPKCDFNNEKNHIGKQEGSNDYCYEENGEIHISMDAGDTFAWDTSVLIVEKLGDTLAYTVSMNGIDYTGKSISFNNTGNYKIVYTYTDDNNYAADSNGNVIMYSKKYEQILFVNVNVVKAAWKDAEIKVNNTAMSGIYVMSGDYDYSYKMKFLDCVTITDYNEKGNASTVDLSKNIKSTSFVDKNGANPGKFDSNSGTITITYNDGKVLTVSIGTWSGSGPSTKTCSVKTNDGVYLITDGASNAANTGVTWKITGYTYTGNNGAIVENNTTITFTWDTNSEGYNSKSECVTPDTLITLADGTQVRVDSLTGNEELLVWNMITGKLDKAPILFVDSEEEAEYEIVHLYFSDGTDVKVIAEHGFWDYDLNKYVYLDRYAEKYIGHTFAKQNGDYLERVELVDVMIETEVTTAWSPVTVGHLCYFVNGMLSMPGGVGGLFNIFEVDPDTMTYDFEQMEKDIEIYGLYTYEELNAICPLSEEMFNAAGGAYLKISIAKGNLTIEELIAMIERYSRYI